MTEAFYKMNNKHRGDALIFYHSSFDKALDLPERSDADKDKSDLIDTLESLAFTVHPCENFTFQNILSKVQKTASNKKNSKKDCFIVFILSHGKLNGVYAKDKLYDPKILWDEFRPTKNAALQGKPILFFINACQGPKCDSGLYYGSRGNASELKSGGESGINNPQNVIQRFQPPNQRDLLVGYSSPPGFESFSTPLYGAWYVQEFCNVMNLFRFEKTMLEILTKVSLYVAVNYESSTSDEFKNQKKQTPCFWSQLTKKLQFTERN